MEQPDNTLMLVQLIVVIQKVSRSIEMTTLFKVSSITPNIEVFLVHSCSNNF